MATKTIIITAFPAARAGSGGNTVAIRKVPIQNQEFVLPKIAKTSFVAAAAAPAPKPKIIVTPVATVTPVQTPKPAISPPIVVRPAVVNHQPKRAAPKEWEEEENDEPQHPRKRERLTHMTAEEKMYRRKMKNRIAAQTARDRKKARMDDLEDLVKQLETENKALQRENNKLRQKTTHLSAENSDLKKQLEVVAVSGVGECEMKPTCVTLGSAASISGPLPWEQMTKKASSVSLASMLTTLTLIFKLFSAKSSPIQISSPSSWPLKDQNSSWMDSAKADKLALKLEQLQRLLAARRIAGAEAPTEAPP